MVFRIASGTEHVFHGFAGGAGGASPYSGLVRDAAGNFYGTTFGGGSGAGIVYKLSPAGVFTVLYTFAGGSDGANPYAGVILDPAGNLYGTTSRGGSSNFGVVYELTTAGTETVLYSFTGGTDGQSPVGGVVRDSAGNLYGTTQYGGSSNHGVVYQLSPTLTETVLHNFSGGSDGANPQASLLMGATGTLFGTDYYGGLFHAPGGDGVIFKLTP